MFKLILKIFFIILFISFNFSYAKVENPIDFLKNINKDILLIVDKNSHLNENKLNEVLGNYIVSHINFNEMCIWIVGKDMWNISPIVKKDEFINEFKRLVIRTYSTTLSRYVKSKVTFFSNNFLSKDVKHEYRVQISSEIEPLDIGRNLHVDYRLIYNEHSWQLYDLIIEGVSILKGFRAQFGNDAKKYGIDYVINKIKQHNL